MSKVNNWLLASYPKEKYTPGFDRLTLAFELFHFDFTSSKVLTVAGTNGKGTVSRLLFENIKLNSKNVAVFSSPHLFSISERFQFSNSQVDEDKILNHFTETHEKLISKDIHLSFYEFTLVVFLRLCIKNSTEYIILEVGLGGRLDATNLIDANVACITSISRDHVELLGNSYKSILFEKLGVIKSKTKAFASFELDYLVQESQKYCEIRNLNISLRKDENDISKRNIFLVHSCLDHLGLAFHEAILKRVASNGKFLYSCAHNLAAVRNLVSNLKNSSQLTEDVLIILSYSHRDIKELEYMSKLFLELKPLVKGINLTHLRQFKAAKLDDLKFISKKLNIAFMDEENLKNAIRQSKKIYLSGSNYFIGTFINKFK